MAQFKTRQMDVDVVQPSTGSFALNKSHSRATCFRCQRKHRNGPNCFTCLQTHSPPSCHRKHYALMLRYKTWRFPVEDKETQIVTFGYGQKDQYSPIPISPEFHSFHSPIPEFNCPLCNPEWSQKNVI